MMRTRSGVAVALAFGLAVSGGRGFGQAELRNPTQPIPVVSTGGHHGPVRALAFTRPDGAFLLSAGMDKVVNAWDLRGARPALARTIRPRIWRGPAGVLYAMALSPAADAGGHRILAVAGYGVDNNQGEIKLFRFPGAPNRPTGDLVHEIPSGEAGPQPRGHVRTVACLAFDPTGRYLASGSADATVRVWDLADPVRPAAVAVLRGHAGAVLALAYTPDGRRIVTGGADGLVVLWDAARGVEIRRARPDPARHRGDPDGAAVNTQMLAVSPDGRLVVVGRENGDLVRYRADDLGGEALMNPRPANAHGAVEAVAISPDGSTLAASVVTTPLTDPARRPRVECHVELRRMPDGGLLRRLPDASNLIHALAFSPDGRRLAYAGGDTQAVTMIDPADPAATPVELAGQGGSVWDVGFAADGRSVGFSRTRVEPDGPAPPYEDFDLQGRRQQPYAQGELRRAVLSWNGWRFRPVGPYRVDVVDAAGRGFTLALDPREDRRWWSSTFLPPAEGHPRPAVAVGCEAGVAVYSLDTGTRTRLFAGHDGAPVYALAPSPDGKWLVTGSADQTVRFWRLEGCDTLAAVGARFEPSPGSIGKVAAVDRRGFAESMGMRAGDVIEALFVGPDAKPDLKALDGVPPAVPIVFHASRDGRRVSYGTTRRDPPALTLFPALDREWVLWTPSGLYETSPLGDRRYLGWHRNPADVRRPTDFFAFDRFEGELRRPEALARFLQSADPETLQPAAEVAGLPPVPAVPNLRLPDVRVDAPGRRALDPLTLPGVALALRVRASKQPDDGEAGRGLIRAFRVFVDSEKAAEVPIDPPAPAVDRPLTLNLNPGRHRVSVAAVDDRGKERVEAFDVVASEPPRVHPAELNPRLFVLSVGAGTFDAPPAVLPPIPFAAEDARDVAAFLAAPDGSPRYRGVEPRVLAGPAARSGQILRSLDDLDALRQRRELGQGDTLFVWVESHYLGFGKDGAFLGSDAAADAPGAAGVAADRLTETLGALAEYGCRVVVLVDALHEARPASQHGRRAFHEWVRGLYARNVVTFAASIHGPSRRHLTHGVFAEAVLNSLNVRGQGRLNPGGRGPLTLDEFQDRVSKNVLAATGRKQFARCYVPETLSSAVPIFDPPARRQPGDLRASRE